MRRRSGAEGSGRADGGAFPEEEAVDTMNLLESLFRWFHVVAGIFWIGHLYFFNFVNAQVAPLLDAESKKKVVPELMPRALFWFRWGALFTWVTGFFLLGLVYYMGKQTLLPDVRWSSLPLAMLAVTFLAPFAYDAIVKFLLKSGPALFWGGFVLVCAALAGYHRAEFTMRGWTIHLGAMFGTIMAFNVWFRIWPAQKRIITAVKGGTKPEDADVALAGARSRHNTYMSVPLVFMMIGQHATWTSSYAEGVFPWLTALVVLFGWALTFHFYGISKKVKGF
jgi:uncharacterized membrane protein